MAKTTLDLRSPTVTVGRQPDPPIPTVPFSDQTKGTILATLGKELLESTLEGMNVYLNNKARSEMQGRYDNEMQNTLREYQVRALRGEDINDIVAESEEDIKGFFEDQRGSAHNNYWADILGKEALAKNRAALTSAFTDGMRAKQNEDIQRDFRTEFLKVDRNPDAAVEAMRTIARLGDAHLRANMDPNATATQMIKWQDEIGITAVLHAAESSALGGRQLLAGLQENMSVGAIKRAQDIIVSADKARMEQDRKAIELANSRERVNTMMVGKDMFGNPVFIDPDNKQNQRDMNNDYALTKLEAANGVVEEDLPGALMQAVRSYGEKVRRTGIIPDDYASDIRAHLNSGDIGLMKRAASDIESITLSGMKMSKKLDSNLIADAVQIMRWARSGVPDDTIKDRIMEYKKNRVEFKEYREKSWAETIKRDKTYEKDVADKTFPSHFYQIGPFAPPKLPGEFVAEAARNVEHYYIYQNMDLDAAKEATAKDMRQSWGMTRRLDGTKEIMLYPPEMAYPGPSVEYPESEITRPGGLSVEPGEIAKGMLGGKHWTAVALEEELKTWDTQKKYDPNRISLTFDRTDDKTNKIVYRLMYRNDRGGLEEVFAKIDGEYQPATWFPNPAFYIKKYRENRMPENKELMMETFIP
jgi:hypothetical protein